MGQLIPLLEKKNNIYNMLFSKNIFFRIFEMVIFTFKNIKNCNYILLDTYSSRGFWYVYIISSIAKVYKKKYITILHGGGLPLRLKSFPLISKSIFNQAYLNISPSLFLKHHFRKAGYKTKYIPNIVNTDLYNFKLRKNIKPKLLWVRSFHEVYNPLLAVDILYRLLKKYPESELCMIGPDKDGTMIKVKNRIKELDIDKSITIKGYLKKQEWVELSINYDIFINTTSFDNHPVSLIEAMLLGIPIVSSNVGWIPYLINDNLTGLLSAPGDIDSFLNNIIKLLKGNYSEKITIEARKKAESFSWSQVEPLWEKVFKED